MTKTLQQVDANRFVITSKAKSFVGSITEESHFLLIDSELLPVSYRYFRRIFGKKSDQRIVFDWENKKARYTRSDKPERNKEYAIEKGVLDPALYQLKLQQELFTLNKNQQENSESNTPTFSYRFAKTGRVRTMDFSIVQDTEYQLQQKTLTGKTLTRINQKKDKHTDIVILPELNYQIAKIVHTDEDGSTHTVKLDSYEEDAEKVRAFYQRLSKASAIASASE